LVLTVSFGLVEPGLEIGEDALVGGEVELVYGNIDGTRFGLPVGLPKCL
jgi:hypothetical protein